MNKRSNPAFRSGKKWNFRDRFVHVTQQIVREEHTDPSTGVVTHTTKLSHPVQYVKGS